VWVLVDEVEAGQLELASLRAEGPSDPGTTQEGWYYEARLGNHVMVGAGKYDKVQERLIQLMLDAAALGAA
jgi:hypothetical protein